MHLEEHFLAHGDFAFLMATKASHCITHNSESG